MNEAQFQVELKNNLKEYRINGQHVEMIALLNTHLTHITSTVKYFGVSTTLANHMLMEFYEIVCECLDVEEIPELETDIRLAYKIGRSFYCVELMEKCLEAVKNKYSTQEASKVSRCTFCGDEQKDVETKYVQGYEILETCTTCEEEILKE